MYCSESPLGSLVRIYFPSHSLSRLLHCVILQLSSTFDPLGVFCKDAKPWVPKEETAFKKRSYFGTV